MPKIRWRVQNLLCETISSNAAFHSVGCSEWLSLILFDPAGIGHSMVRAFVFASSVGDLLVELQSGRGWSEITSQKTIHFIA